MNPEARATRRDNTLRARGQRAANRSTKAHCKAAKKTRLASFESAVASALRLSYTLGRPIRAYECDDCGGWHLTRSTNRPTRKDTP